jgi:outer membrane immunogenic protein
MKRLLLGTTALFAFAVTGPALAADIPTKAPAYKAPVVAPVYYTWTGCYIGGNGGGLWARKDYGVTVPTVAVPGTGVFTGGTIPLGSQDLSGWEVGGQIGCNYQVGSWVFGIQGDYDWANARASSSGQFGLLSATENARISGLASVTGRVGYAWDRFLWYVKGGVAWERDNYDALVAFAGIPFIGATDSEWRTGWTVGAGGEYAFTDYLTGFVEGDYYDFGTRTSTFTTFPVTFGLPIDIRERKFVAKAGFNWKFNWWSAAPVVSKY